MYRFCTQINEVSIINKSFEYKKATKLQGKAEMFYPIPVEIILHPENRKLVSVFSYFMVRRGLDRTVLFSLDYIVKWLGKHPNRNAKGINPKLNRCIDELKKMGYLDVDCKISNAKITEAGLNLDQVTKKCDCEVFATVYLDELEKILNYKDSGNIDSYFGNDVVLLVFSYLRMCIYKRKNELKPEFINAENKNNHEYDVQLWKKTFPEAYDCYFHEIGEVLGLTERSVSKALYALKDLELIYFEELPKYKIGDEWRTDHTIFCNTYKREKGYLMATGKAYYLNEIENKKKKIQNFRYKQLRKGENT